MRRSRAWFSIALLALALTTSILWAKTYEFTLYHSASLNGQKLEAGRYKLELTGSDKVNILRDGKSVAEATAEVKPLPSGKATNTVVLSEDGAIVEIRVGNKSVVFSR